MKKSNRILLGLVITVSVALAYFLLSKSGTTLKGELRDFAIEDTAAIDRIFIVDKLGKSALLERKGKGYWLVNNAYQARQDAVNNLLLTLKKLAIKAPVAKSMEENVLKDLAGPLQKKVEVYASGKKIKTIYVGGETIDKQGTFMLLEHSSVPFEIHIPGHRGFLQTRFITDERIWRDQTIFAAEKSEIREIQVKYLQNPANSFTISIPDGGSPQLAGPAGIERADTLLLNQYIAQYRRFGFEYVITDETFPASRKDSILNSEPFIEIRLKTRKGEVNSMKGYHRAFSGSPVAPDSPAESDYDPERIYALVNERDFVLVQYYQLDRLLVRGIDFIK